MGRQDRKSRDKSLKAIDKRRILNFINTCKTEQVSYEKHACNQVCLIIIILEKCKKLGVSEPIPVYADRYAIRQ